MGCVLKIGSTELTKCSIEAGQHIVLNADGNAITTTTDIPSDPVAAYNTFITQKRDAMTNGGTVTLGATTQTFTSGYDGIRSSCLMSLNGVTGPSVSFVPSVGIWLSTASSDSGLQTTIARLPGCITCRDWNTLFALEMTLYHAINKLAWRILRSNQFSAPIGSWQLYQGVIAAWALVAYRSQFICSIQTVREALDINIGYSNATCSTYSVYVEATVHLASAATGSIYSFMVFYPQGTQTSVNDGSFDSNKTINSATGGPLTYVARTGTGAWLINNTDSIMHGAVNDLAGSSYTMDSYSNSGVTNPDDLASKTSGWSPAGDYKLGLAVYNVASNKFYLKRFTLGLRPIVSNVQQGSVTREDTYDITVRWWVYPNTYGHIPATKVTPVTKTYNGYITTTTLAQVS